jgi:hypothetical protein
MNTVLGSKTATRILFVVEAVLGEVDRSLVGMKISPMHEGDLMAAHGETRLATQFDSVPRSAARRWVIRQTSTRFVGFSVSTPVRPRSGRGALPPSGMPAASI